MNAKIFHYHLFKNAGTSVDSILQQNFGSRWKEKEFEHDMSSISDEVQSWIDSNADACAFSSHTAVGPLPNIENGCVIPILFIRHPLDRLRSAYSFERLQSSNNYGSVIARETTFGGYLRVRLALPDERFARNFHASRLGYFADDIEGDEYVKAIIAMDRLRFVGVVDEFDQSMKIFASIISNHFPGFSLVPAWENSSTSKDLSLSDNLAMMEEDIGVQTWNDLVEANSIDLEIYHEAKRRLHSNLE